MKLIIEMPDEVPVSSVYLDVFGMVRDSKTTEWTGGQWFAVGYAPKDSALRSWQILPRGVAL